MGQLVIMAAAVGCMGLEGQRRRAQPTRETVMLSQKTEAIVLQPILQDIERIIDEARIRSSIVRAGYHAGELLRAYPMSGLSLGRIVDEIVLAAASAGVPVEIGRQE